MSIVYSTRPDVSACPCAPAPAMDVIELTDCQRRPICFQRQPSSRAGGGTAPTPGAGAAGRRRKYQQRHEAQGKLFVRERIDKLLDPGSPFLELSPLAAVGPVRRRSARRGHRHRHRAGERARMPDRRQRRDGQGRHVLPDDGQEASARAADRRGESSAVHLSGGLGRRVPADAGRGLSRTAMILAASSTIRRA